MRTQRVTFPRIERYGFKHVYCATACGKRVKLQRTFWQTLSPFNKNGDGSVKTVADIYAELKIEQQAWKEKLEYCVTCRKTKKVAA